MLPTSLTCGVTDVPHINRRALHRYLDGLFENLYHRKEIGKSSSGSGEWHLSNRAIRLLVLTSWRRTLPKDGGYRVSTSSCREMIVERI